MASARVSRFTRWRHYCLRLFCFSLLSQTLVWSYLTLQKRPRTLDPLGRKDIKRHRHWKRKLNPLEQRRMTDLGLDLFGSKEISTDVVVSDTESFPFRQKRLTENTAISQTVPGVDDVYSRLEEYLHGLTQNHFYSDTATAKRMQKRTTAAEMHALPVDSMNETFSISARIQFLNKLGRKAREKAEVTVSIVTTSSVDIWGLRMELLPWMQYHTHLGVTHFYLLYDGSDVDVVDLLEGIHHLTLIHIHPPFASQIEMHRFRSWRDHHEQWKGRPGNYELMIKQSYGTQLALYMAKANGDDWLLHIDPDELFYPDNTGFSISDEFLRQPDHISSIRFMNFEGQPEFGDITNRYEQVTLFRTHKYFITPEANYLRHRCKLGDNRTFLVLYANGKSAVRVNAPGVAPMGPHFFKGDPSDRWKTDMNPQGDWKDVISNFSVILHYGYSYLSDVTEKAKRSCPEEMPVLDVSSQERDPIENCFVIDFDRDAYIAAINGDEEDFFYSRQVLSEGIRLKCLSNDELGWCIVHNVEYFKFLLTKAGLFRRLREPQQILRMHEYLIQCYG